MKEIAILLKLMNMYAHNAHNLVERVVFMQDHEHLADLYEAYDVHYDDVVERIIGLTDSSAINLVEIATAACMQLKTLPPKENENVIYFQKIEEMEKKLRAQIAAVYPTSSIGTQQMIGDIADKSEQRSYKLKARIKK